MKLRVGNSYFDAERKNTYGPIACIDGEFYVENEPWIWNEDGTFKRFAMWATGNPKPINLVTLFGRCETPMDEVERKEGSRLCEYCGHDFTYHSKKHECQICSEKQIVGDYDDWICKKCGQKYTYDEGINISLSEDQLKLLRKAWAIQDFTGGDYPDL